MRNGWKGSFFNSDSRSWGAIVVVPPCRCPPLFPLKDPYVKFDEEGKYEKRIQELCRSVKFLNPFRLLKTQPHEADASARLLLRPWLQHNRLDWPPIFHNDGHEDER